MCRLKGKPNKKKIIEHLRRKRRANLQQEKWLHAYFLMLLIWILGSKPSRVQNETETQQFWDHVTLQDMRRAQDLYHIQHPRYPDMPPRYRNEIPPLNVLIDYLAVDHLRDDAFTVILKITPASIHEWLKDTFITEGHRIIRLCKKPKSEDTLNRLISMAEKWKTDMAEEEIRRGQARYEYRPDDAAFAKNDDEAQGPKPKP